MAKKAKVIKEKSIEDRIWDSANKLRNMRDWHLFHGEV